MLAFITEVAVMDLSNQFDFLAPGDIRVRGTRIGIETILKEYLYEGRTPDAIVQRHPSLSLAEVHATLAYYYANREAVEAYLSNWIDASRRAREHQDRSPSPGVARLRALKYGGANGEASHE
jgi:uncharacterized protein (DUF433 family)